MAESGILHIVATPIGNLEDITIRAIKTLLTVDGIACEDTRKTGMLLKHIEKYRSLVYDTKLISKERAASDESRSLKSERVRLIPYHEHVEQKRIPEIINALKNRLNIAVVSDAGTPGISDPGFRLIRECIARGIQVESIPGATSVISALVTSGLPTDKFLFLGYPPHKGGKRKQLYEAVKKSEEYVKATVILFEAPHKLVKTLAELQDVFGDIDIVLTRELTKVHEEVRREKISESLEHFKKTNPKGEFVLVFNLNKD
jgi:16S rRNA (cytidine1402-2'-O)-methyltransferase